MPRTLAAMLLLLGASAPVSAKLLCPPGRFMLHTQDARAAKLDGRELVLGEGKAEIMAACRAVKASGYHRPSGRWFFRVRAKWQRCAGRSLALRARFDLEDSAYCTRLTGVVRLGNRQTIPVVADRIPECGNGLREVGEQCDDGVETPCCGVDCRVKPGCPVACDRNFACADGEMCVYTCGQGGKCQPRSEVSCGVWPVCDCNEQAMYPNRCAAYEAGTGPLYAGPCRRYCLPGRAGDCAATEFCSTTVVNECERWQSSRPTIHPSICTAIPYTCEGKPDAPVCGCNGVTYRNDCELRRARMASYHLGPCS